MIKHCFNKAAATYDEHSDMQQIIGEQLLLQLQLIPHQTTRVIDLGCGTGLTTAKLAKQSQYTHFCAIDIADQLLEKAKQRLSPLAIEVKQMDFQMLVAANFDLAFANLTLQWGNLSKSLASINAALANQGTLAFSIPLHDHFPELMQEGKNSFLEPTCLIQQLKHAHFNCLHFHEEKRVASFESARHALQSIKAVGANYVFQRSHKALRGKNWLQHFTSTLTYHVGYFIAQKKPS